MPTGSERDENGDEKHYITENIHYKRLINFA